MSTRMYTVRDNLGDEDYKKYKTHYDELMHYRKTIKGKPTLEQRIQLLCNAEWIDYYKTLLFHVSWDANCDCRACSLKRQGIDIYDKTPHQMDFWTPMPEHKITFVDKLEKIFKDYSEK